MSFNQKHEKNFTNCLICKINQQLLNFSTNLQNSKTFRSKFYFDDDFFDSIEND